ncbi:GNAT family N-acetyltransferase [Aureibaculum marinum]|uniref:GNAT family N-acetyltransferase n=1 Tax=Aureibaculum marinum TaxID=2487930 RepID=A0A3N4P3A9_9FLAO|nr:GNAT family N-acetyltransferase [Aureibaculum marinum]RPE00899.1 GNAT family N-acetyltransferase [Aureibaculum marinum]
MKISLLKPSEVNDNLAKQVKDLFSLLNSEIKQKDLKELFNPKNDIVFAYCMDEEKLAGMALMCTYTVVSGYKGWVEDVVVHHDYRGQGLGRKLMNKLLEEGKRKGLSEILLFSNDKRKVAINLYKSLAFQQKHSGLYILKMD